MQQRRNAADQLQAERGREHQHVHAYFEFVVGQAFTPSRACTFGCTISPSRITIDSRVISSFVSMCSSPSFTIFFRKVAILRPYIWLASCGTLEGRFTGPRTVT